MVPSLGIRTVAVLRYVLPPITLKIEVASNVVSTRGDKPFARPAIDGITRLYEALDRHCWQHHGLP